MFIGQNNQERFQENNRFAEARIQIEMAFVQRIPKGLVFQILATRQVMCRFGEFAIQVVDQVTQYRRLVNELRTLRKKDAVQETGDPGGTLATRSTKVPRIQGGCVGHQSEVLSVAMQGGKKHLQGL